MIALIFIAASILVAAMALTAPEGWEDAETGFHYGRPDHPTSPSSEAA